MRRPLLILALLVIFLGMGVFLFAPTQRIYALASRTVEFTFVFADEETKQAIPGASMEIWNDPVHAADRKKIAHLVADSNGVAKYIRENHSVEDVIGISASQKLGGVRRHPAGIGTFVDRFWCTFNIAAPGYVGLQYQSLGDYEYDDNGFDKEAKLHRFEFVIPLRRKVGGVAPG